MCGIVGLYLKNPQLEARLGTLFEPMLQAMTDRGPDSAGFAIYGDEVADGWVKLTLQATDIDYPWTTLMGQLEGRLGCSLDWFQNASAAVLKIHCSEAAVREALAELAPTLRIMSAGQSIEILKGMGLPREISERFGLKDKDKVAVRLDTERPMILEDVLVRVSDSFKLAMHIDADEGNSSGWKPGTTGTIIGHSRG